LTRISRTGPSSWESKKIISVSFAPLVLPPHGGRRPGAAPLRESPRGPRGSDPHGVWCMPRGPRGSDPHGVLVLLHFAAEYEVRTLQDLARICIRHTLRVSPEGPGGPVSARGSSSFSVGRGLAAAGLHKYGPRFKRRRVHRRRRCSSALVLATRQVVASIGPAPLAGHAPLVGNDSQGGRGEGNEEAGRREGRQQTRGRRTGRGAGGVVEEEEMEEEEEEGEEEQQEEEEEEEEEGEEKEEETVLRPQPAVNLLRERVLSLPLPEPLKMFLLYYRER